MKLPRAMSELRALHTRSAVGMLDDLRAHEAHCKRCAWVGGIVVDGKKIMQKFRSCPAYRRIRKDRQKNTDEIMRMIEKISRLERAL